MIFSSSLALRSITKMTGKFECRGASLGIVVFCSMISLKVAVEMGMLFTNGGVLAGFQSNSLFLQILTGGCWLVFDIIPISAVLCL